VGKGKFHHGARVRLKLITTNSNNLLILNTSINLSAIDWQPNLNQAMALFTKAPFSSISLS
jgi:hypothetical protein